MAESFDIIIIGAGIAGASVAAELSGTASVAILEMESAPGYHTTGRSAAMFVPGYGPPVIRALTRASEAFFRAPPEGFANTPVILPRGELLLAGPGDETLIEDARAMGMCDISLDEAKRHIPPLKTQVLTAALFDARAEDLDVDILHQGFLKTFRRNSGKVICDAEAYSLSLQAGRWRIETRKGLFDAPIVVNAAGAWADEIARRAGLSPLGIQPKRRSAVLLPVPEDWYIADWPLVFGAGENFYFRPMGGELMLSPADETPVDPHDAWADDMLIAGAVEHFQNCMDFEVTRIGRTWGGLRTFAPDGDPVVGYDDGADGFFWLAGQGGYGIQTSPALARVAAALMQNCDIPDDTAEFGVSQRQLTPQRFN